MTKIHFYTNDMDYVQMSCQKLLTSEVNSVKRYFVIFYFWDEPYPLAWCKSMSGYFLL